MIEKFQIESIGEVKVADNTFSINLDQKFVPGLKILKASATSRLSGGHILTDDPNTRSRLVLPKLFVNGPDQIGVFATRSPVRPNPMMVSIIKI